MQNFKKAISLVLCILTLCSVLSFAVSAASYNTDYSNYTPGTCYYRSPVMKNTSAVRYYQRAINYCVEKKGFDKAYRLDCDSSFGPACEKACRAWQSWANRVYGFSLSIDGSFGPASQKAMAAILNGSAAKKSDTSKTVSLSASDLIWPLADGAGTVSHKAGEKRTNEIHVGVDITAKAGTKVIAIADGTVLQSSKDDGKMHSERGYYLCIQHGNYICVYQHLIEQPTLKKGNKVTRGQVIGKVGNTGHSSGDHLHFEIALASTLTKSSPNPREYLWTSVNSFKKSPTYYSAGKGAKAGSYYKLTLNSHI